MAKEPDTEDELKPKASEKCIGDTTYDFADTSDAVQNSASE